MRAVTLATPGGQPPSSCFTLAESYPKPTLPSPDWVLVRVRAIGINRSELRQRNNEPANPISFGLFAGEYHSNKPAVLGEEFVGEVEVPGDNTDFSKGDRVTGVYYGGGKAYDGCYAEYTLIRKEVCRRLPGAEVLTIGDGDGQVSWAALASFPGSGWTAWGSLFQSADTKQGETVIVRGATSSVGVWAVLLAKARGCTVIATTRQESKVAKLKSIGADHVVLERGKHGTPDFDNMVADTLAVAPKGAKTVLDLVDPSSFAAFGFRVCASYGTVVPTGILGKGYAPMPFSVGMIPSTKRLSFHGGVAVADQVDECFREIALGIRDGKYKQYDFLPVILTLGEIGQAHDLLEKNELVGKVVLNVEHNV